LYLKHIWSKVSKNFYKRPILSEKHSENDYWKSGLTVAKWRGENVDFIMGVSSNIVMKISIIHSKVY